jgi:hypothetical protein
MRMKMKTRTTLSLTLTIITTFIAGSTFGKYSGGTGDPCTPYQIATKTDLLVLAADANDYNKYFILTADIDLDPNLPGGQIFTTAIIAPDTNSATDFQGTPFTGTFDGNGHKITHLTINGGSNRYLGLFGRIAYTSKRGLVENLCLENCAISGYVYIGGLVADCSGGIINNCYSTGTVSGSGYIGGLVANCYVTGSSITNCHSTVAVNASGGQFVGGLVGINSANISQCYATGAVNGSASVGGLVGVDGGNISTCYSTGTVSGSSYVGGLVGRTSSSTSVNNSYSIGTISGHSYIGGLVGGNYGSISNSYSIGTVSGTSYVCGFGGYNFPGYGSVSGSFWDTQTSNRTTSDGGEGKTTAEMKTLSTFTSAGWDFVDAWVIGNGQSYPYLKPFNGINPADLNYDGAVDFVDLAILAANWLSGE